MDALRKWQATLSNWFRGLAQREQRAVLAGAGACVLLLLLALWLPVERRVANLERRVHTKQADLAWLQSVAPQLSALRNSSAAGNGESLVVLVDRVARATGIARALSGSQPGDDGTLSVRLEVRRGGVRIAFRDTGVGLDMADIGKAAPEFKLKSHDGSEVSLSQYQGSKWLVISAYPFAFTGG